jgi:hypothetical protein
MEESDIYYIDTRNATNDHRTGGGPVIQSGSGWRPSSTVRPVIGQPARVFTAPVQPQIIYAAPPQTAMGSLLGKVTAGQLVDLVAQIFAALMPLPAAPVATSEAATDVGNLILYQGALAQYAKKDEQVRTLGNIITKLIG